MQPSDLSDPEKTLLVLIAQAGEHGLSLPPIQQWPRPDVFVRLRERLLVEAIKPADLDPGHEALEAAGQRVAWKVTPEGRSIAEAIEAADPKDDHGIEGGAYRRGPDGKTPTLFCLCGHEADGATWEEAGAALDAHLEKALRGGP